MYSVTACVHVSIQHCNRAALAPMGLRLGCSIHGRVKQMEKDDEAARESVTTEAQAQAAAKSHARYTIVIQGGIKAALDRSVKDRSRPTMMQLSQEAATWALDRSNQKAALDSDALRRAEAGKERGYRYCGQVFGRPFDPYQEDGALTKEEEWVSDILAPFLQTTYPKVRSHLLFV